MVVSLVVALLLAPAAASASQSGPVDTAVSTEAAASGIVKMADLSQFQAGNIISDARFFDRGTMTEAQIQQFLQSRVPSCQSGYVCLKDAYDTSRATSADAMCGAYSGGIRERASAIIYKVAQACGINPQVILVMLQKEQGLVTHTWPSDWRYTIAMGQGCPDTAACDTRYYGFFNQVYGAAWQLKRYANPPGTSQYFTWYAPGKTWNVRWHPNAGCGSSAVHIQNQATANLYYYTPYQPNAAAIRAGYGEGDSCSSYGNRNFYQYFTDWFGSTQRSACDQPPYEEVRSGPGEFVTGGPVIARQTAYVQCEVGTVSLQKGVRVTGAAVWRNWSWVDVNGQMLWIPTGFLNPWNPCDQPPYEEVRSGPGEFVTGGPVIARQTAYVECEVDTVPLEAGVRVTGAAVWRNWSWVDVDGRMLWIPTGFLNPFNACDQPPYEQVRGASGEMVARGAITGRAAPSVACQDASVSIAAGRRVKLAAKWNGWYWVDLAGRMLWVAEGDLEANPCDQPPYAEVRGASGEFATLRDAAGRAGPSAECAAGQQSLPAGTTVKIAAQWADWYWVDRAGTMLWVAKSDLGSPVCDQPPYGEVRGASGAAAGGAGAIGRGGPSDACTGRTASLEGRGMKLAAQWADWYWVEVDGVMHWARASAIVTAGESVVSTVSLNLRSGPSTGDAIVRTLAPGTGLSVLAVSGGWLQVRLDAQTTGWVSAAYVR